MLDFIREVVRVSLITRSHCPLLKLLQEDCHSVDKSFKFTDPLIDEKKKLHSGVEASVANLENTEGTQSI